MEKTMNGKMSGAVSMNRRGFIGASTAAVAAAGLTASATSVCALEQTQLKANSGRKVRLEGWLSPATDGPGHFMTLTRDGAGAAPAFDVSALNLEAVRILPEHADRMRTGRVVVEGRLQVGRFPDAVTGQIAGALLLNARLV